MRSKRAPSAAGVDSFTPKRKKGTPYPFVLDLLADVEPVTNPLFGTLAVYVGEKIMLALRDKESAPQDNGIWFATTKEHHASLQVDFPEMRSISVLGPKITGWQLLPADSRDFENAAERLCRLIASGDARIGKVPAARKRRKKPASKGAGKRT